MIEYSALLNGCLTASRQRKKQLKIDAAQQQHDRPVIISRNPARLVRRKQISRRSRPARFLFAHQLFSGAEPQRSDHSSRFMMMILRTAVCVAAIMCIADTAPAIAKKARLVCEYGRCWQTGAGYDYQYGYRPPTKWEQKGFCPPGQAKKGNC